MTSQVPVDWTVLGGAASVLTDLAATYRSALTGNAPLSAPLADALLRDLEVCFEDSLHLHSQLLGIDDDVRDGFERFARMALSRLGADRVRTFAGIRSPEVRQAWLAALLETDLQSDLKSPVVQLHETPAGPRVRYCLYSIQAHHTFDVADGGTLADSKVRSVQFFGAHWVFEHNLLIDVDGRSVVRIARRGDRAAFPLERDGLAQTISELTSATAIRTADMEESRVIPSLFGREWWARKRLGIPLRLANAVKWTRRYRDAWALADRVDQANDNAEVLFRYLHAERPDINAWFVVDRKVPVYRDLRRAGARVVAYGSFQHFALMKHARIFACSQSDNESRLPFGPGFMHQTWRFVYLKHGILHTDHHRRFNPMQIHLVLAATSAEQAVLTRDGGQYRFAPSEVALTGMPRHDRLDTALAARKQAGPADILLIAPTWRIYLGSKNPDHSWSVVPDFADTEYVREWRSLLSQPGLQEACERAGVTPVFLMHPRFERHARLFDVPDWVRVENYQSDIAPLISRTRLLVTDYSSLAFEAAYVEAPTVYFQFDRKMFFSGGHSGQAGDFEYRKSGFGPVVEAADEAVGAIDQVLNGDGASAYAGRIAAQFAVRDSRNSERAVRAIESVP